jgi:hypothetical protein
VRGSSSGSVTRCRPAQQGWQRTTDEPSMSQQVLVHLG